MAISPLAGKPAPKSMLVDLAHLERDYYERQPDVTNPNQLVSFGTSGHRGSSLDGTFTEAHILAITQAICDYRVAHKTSGPLYMGKDTHALSGPAQRTALEVLAANEVQTVIQQGDGVTPTPVISRAILVHNRDRKTGLADGIVITPSHFRELTAEFGTPYYTRIDAAAIPEQKARLAKLAPEVVKESKLAGDAITAKLTRAPGNNAPIGGLKVTTSSGWFAARPSGTENIYKIYAESFRGEKHLQSIVTEAQTIVDNALGQ